MINGRDNFLDKHRLSLEVNPLSRVLRGHLFEVLDECFLTIPHVGIVLYIDIAYILIDSLLRLALVKHQVIEALRVSFVLF